MRETKSGDCFGHRSEHFSIPSVGTIVGKPRLDVNAPTWHIRLAEAALCVEGDCNAVFALRRGECPACASRNWVPLERVANGGREQKRK